MILNDSPQNEAILSNVGTVNSFSIKATAKSFRILSDGLYANKVRAIIRELSCNAYDSHVAAGKKEMPFDVHLPNALEPYFSIRDYGIGLSQEDVTNIFTTFFESTKTGSNDFVGALGLGSKSPFSYTDNFTVTAIKDGVKGIYTAFINESGVPSIALMMSEESDEPTGVEIKFAVESASDFTKFHNEARDVFTYFATLPVVSGNENFKFNTVHYVERDIVPGIHQMSSRGGSVAIMGNIAYPINIPAAEAALGDLVSLLKNSLEIHFNIGELDFQASREGLSYIPLTVNAIKSKLEQLSAALVVVMAKEADAIENLWDRALFISKKEKEYLWSSVAKSYIAANPIPTIDFGKRSYNGYLSYFNIYTADLAQLYNIQLRALVYSPYGTASFISKNAESEYRKTPNGDTEVRNYWSIGVDDSSLFVIKDTKVGCVERTKFHIKTGETKSSTRAWILEKADKTKEMDLTAFFKAISNPPEDRCILASTLRQQERNTSGRSVSVLRLEKKESRSYYSRDRVGVVWRDAGDTASFDDTKTYYYVPLVGFTMQSSKGYTSAQELYTDIALIPNLFAGNIYGVRKADIESIKKKSNWINFEDHAATLLAKVDTEKMLLSIVQRRLRSADVLNFDRQDKILTLINKDSLYANLVRPFINCTKSISSVYDSDALTRLFTRFAINKTVCPEALTAKYQAEVTKVNARYPLLTELGSNIGNSGAVADYINMCDERAEK